MKLLYLNRSKEDQLLINKVCDYIQEQKILEKPKSDDFCGIFVEGRNREINTKEDITCFHSFKAFSKFNYPIFCFVNNINKFIEDIEYNGFVQDYWRIKIIEIPELNNLDQYSDFCINKLYFMLPNHIENCITLQPDGMLLKSGYENWLIDNRFDFIGAHWQHYAAIDVKTENGFQPMVFPSVPMCNGGFSFRKASKMRLISTKFQNYKLKERFAPEGHLHEDLFFSYLGFGSGICKIPTLKECDIFSCDPLTLNIWNNKDKWPFGFHYIKSQSQFPECNHE